jgi:hypothetical protein
MRIISASRLLSGGLAAVAVLSGCSGADSGPSSGTASGAGTIAAEVGASPAGTARPASEQLPGTTALAGGSVGLLFAAETDAGHTLVTGRDRSTRQPMVRSTLAGEFRFPVVAPAAKVEGVSSDGHVLVLTESDSSRTRFAVLDGTLSTQARILTLPPRFSYDALSPDGSALYLIEHRPPVGSEHYLVRVYDLRTRQLVPGPIADKSLVRDEAGDMAGHPLARTIDPSGALAATLYQRANGRGFIHLLHAQDRFAECLDLPPGPVSGWRLTYRGALLTVQDSHGITRLIVENGQVTPAP